MRCNNHKCVKTPLWRGDLTWSWLDHVTWTLMFVVKSCSWLILVQVPSLYLWLWEFFTPPPLTFISSMLHSFYTYSYDTFISRTGILWAKEPPSTLPTRIDSCPPKKFFVVWMGHLNSIPNCHSGTYTLWGLTISLKIRFLELRFLKRIRHRETTPTPFDGGHEPKIQPSS